ncbi:MAG: tetratricopeptide repeat protein, partial [Planctomycetia bacterium]
VTTLPGQIGGGGGNRPGGIGGGNRPTGPGGVTTLPGQIGAGGNRPGGIGGGNRPGIGGGGNRPGEGGFGGGNRPGGIGGGRPLPGQIGDGNRPGRPGEGGWNQGGRPGIGGNRPNWNGNRPGDFNGNRPNWNNRPGSNGNNNNIGNNVNINNNNFNNYGGGGWGGGYGGGYYGGGGYGGGYNSGWNNGWSNWGAFGVGAGVGALAGWGLGNSWGYGGYGGYGGGYGGYANAWNSGYVNPYYDNWYNGCWGNGWASPVAFGAATLGMSSMVNSWGLGSSSLGYATSYANPYYGAEAATVASASPYDYSQPIVVNNYITSDGGDATTAAQGGDGGAGTAAAQITPAQAEANKALDEALGKFKQGDYPSALASIDRAVKSAPNDTVLHEVRALSLFALGRYPESAATLNSILAVAPGMDWTTMSGLYGSVDTYTGQLRKLEDFCRSNPGSAAGHFVLAYHYLVGGHADLAAEALKVVVAKQPGDIVSKRLLESLEPPAEAKAEEVAAAEATKPAPAPAANQPTAQTPAQAEAPAEAESAGPETDLVGTWKAIEGKSSVTLTIGEDSAFTWKAEPEGKPAIELKGSLDSNTDQIALQTEAQGTMVANVKSRGPDAFDFLVEGAPKDAKPLAFQRQK